MLIDSRTLFGDQLTAFDGNVGHVKDLYFDDKNWVVRYVVADTGSWLKSRLVLLSPHAFGHLRPGATALHVNLSKEQIEQSPPIESHQTVSRKYEVDYFRYYGWPAYWNGGSLWGMAAYPVVTSSLEAEVSDNPKVLHRADKHLRGTREILGYDVQTAEGPVGTVSGLMLDDTSWAVQQMAVDTGHWFSGKEILISTTDVESISYEESRVYVRLSKHEISDTQADEVASGHPVKQAEQIFVD
jgi:uncharacterized protein YrrD